MRLGVMVTYKATRHPDGSVTASDKFLAEMQAYAERWPGPVDVYLATIDETREVLSTSALPAASRDLAYHVTPIESFGFDNVTVMPDVVLSAVDAPLHVVPKRCRELPVATVVGVEYTLKTRLQMLRVQRSDLKGRVGGLKWNLEQEARIVNAVRHADGLQANGYPALDWYGRFSDNAMAYLDNRAYESAMPTRDAVEQRVASAGAGQPLRLAFTGRLESRKGTLECVALAEALRSRGVDFTFLVAGDGPEREPLQRAVSDAGLEDRFDIPGALDFDAELVPRVREQVDVFFCPHPQGDPSCTYIETLAGAVPIVGYANEAVAALAKRTGAVQAVAMGDAGAAAEAIAGLGGNPRELLGRSLTALEFAREHSFEREYQRRIDHLLDVAKRR